MSRILAALLFVALSAGEKPTITAKVTPEYATIGDRISYEVTVEGYAPDTLPTELETDPAFVLLNTRTTEADGKTKITYTLAPFKTGKLKLPVYSIPSREWGGAEELHSPELYINIVSVLPSEGKPELKDIRGSMEAKQDYAAYLWPAAAIFLLLLLSILLFLWLRKRRGAPGIAEKVKVPPVEKAMKELDILERENLCAKGKAREFSYRVSDTVREYIKEEFSFDAPEKTTMEIEASIPRRLEGFKGEIVGLLEKCDTVKFAKASPAAEDGEKTLGDARRLVTSLHSITIPAREEADGAGGNNK